MVENAKHLLKRLEQKMKRGFRGYPIATVAYYGPTDKFVSKVVAGILVSDDAEADPMAKWISDDLDVRQNASVLRQVIEFLDTHQPRSVVITPGIYGCPHEEGTDYPLGETCPLCPFWAGRDRDQIFRSN